MQFTVLIPVYNTPANHLQECWQSIQNQTVKPTEVIFIDDGSTDSLTIYWLDDMLKSGQAIVKTLDKNYGVSHALNVGHGICNTEWIALHGSDDVSHKNRFERQLFELSIRPNYDVIGTQLEAFWDSDPKRKRILRTNHKTFPKAANGWHVNHGTVIYRNSKVKEIGGYNIELRRGQDIDLFNRMILAGHKFYNLHDILYKWRRYIR